MIPSEEVSARRREIEDKLKQVGFALGRVGALLGPGAGPGPGAPWRCRGDEAGSGGPHRAWGRPGTPQGPRHPPPGLGARPGPLQGLVCGVGASLLPTLGLGFPSSFLGGFVGSPVRFSGAACETSPARLQFPLYLWALGT